MRPSIAIPAAMPTTFCSATPSMNQRSGISRRISLSRPGLRSDPMKTTRGSCFAHALLQGSVHVGDGLARKLRLVMPGRIVFGERNAFALHRVADDCGRTIAIERYASESLPESG